MSADSHYISFTTGEDTRQQRRKLPSKWFVLPAVVTLCLVSVVGIHFASQKAPSGLSLEASNINLYSDPQFAKEFETFVNSHGKEYSSLQEKAERYAIFKKNLAFIRVHNSQGHTYTLGLNQFADMTDEEFNAHLTGYKPTSSLGFKTEVAYELKDVKKGDIPSSINWLDKGCVTPVKNQGMCGSCWAFSATGAMEGNACAAGLGLLNLSEQQLNDCSWPEGNMGCRGGLMEKAYEYVIRNGGLCSEEDYPYKGRDLKCASDECKNVLSIKSYKNVPRDDEQSLLAAVANYGPVAIAIQANEPSFQFYKSGVFSGPCGNRLNHGVLAVGYDKDKDSGLDYFLVKNSWGAGWGNKGYIKMARSKGPHGLCGMLLDPSYTIVKK